jgi:uncharacterized protein YecT (DUF1311 family)
MKKIFLALIVIVCFISNGKAIDKPERDVRQLHVAAQKGDARSQLEYGMAIKDQSKKEASEWVQRAADQGLGEAWFLLGYEGLGAENEIFYFKKAIDNGFFEAINDLLDVLLFRAGQGADVKEAKRYVDIIREKNLSFLYSADSFETVDRCYKAGSAKIPAKDNPTPEEINKFKNLQQTCFIYKEGIGVKQDLHEYRKCILSNEADYNNNDIAEIYANGWGVPRDPNLAIALICRGSSVPAELIFMVDTLHSTKDQESLRKEFTYCNNVMSGANSGVCAYQAEDVKEYKRNFEITKIIDKWTDKQRAAFFILKERADEFFSERSTSEDDMSGTSSTVIAMGEKGRLRDEFLKAIKDFENKNFLKRKKVARADKFLNKIYNQLIQKKNTRYYGGISVDGVKLTQYKWLKYRDEWVKFAKIKYPEISSDVFNTFVTEQRIKQLNQIQID